MGHRVTADGSHQENHFAVTLTVGTHARTGFLNCRSGGKTRTRFLGRISPGEQVVDLRLRI